MARSLCLSVTFLHPVYHGPTDNGRGGEWPPSPMRLFQALTAAAFGGCAKHVGADAETFRSALRWLEKHSERHPPEIIAVTATPGTPCTLFVPNNDLDIVGRAWSQNKAPPKELAQLKTAKVVRPHHLREPGRVHFVWPIDEDTEPAEAAAVCRLARRVVVLGWGVDLVACDGRIVGASKAEELHGERWRPDSERRTGRSRGARRVPVVGSLRDLEGRHAAFLNTMNGAVYTKPPPPAVYRAVVYRRAIDAPPRPVTAFALRPTDPEGRRPWQAFRLERAAVVAAMLRHAACNAAEADRDYWADVPGGSDIYVAGHTRDDPALKRGPTPPRFSYLPLPSIGHAHADGMIRRVLIAEPHDGDGRHAEWAATRLAGTDLIDENTDKPVATLERLDPRDWLDEPHRGERVLPVFIGPAREWITATPIVLPGYDGLKTNKAAKLFSRACDQAGLPPGSVESFEFIGPPAHAGSAGCFFAPSYLRGWPLRWAVVCFSAFRAAHRQDFVDPKPPGSGHKLPRSGHFFGAESPKKPSTLASESCARWQ